VARYTTFSLGFWHGCQQRFVSCCNLNSLENVCNIAVNIFKKIIIMNKVRFPIRGKAKTTTTIFWIKPKSVKRFNIKLKKKVE
jgi:hypothetical protein